MGDSTTPVKDIGQTPKTELINKTIEFLRTPIRLPASPMLEKLGYGTGVNVFKINRKLSGSSDITASPWAVKRLSKGTNRHTANIAKRLEREADILRRLNHPNIVGFRGIQKQKDGRLCLAMEEGGKCLMEYIEEHKETLDEPFTAEIIEKVVLDIAKALDYLHNVHKLVHGDIKSQNILIKGENFDIAKLCDFGTSLPLNGDGIVIGEYCCSEPWSPPEVHVIDVNETTVAVTAKADIFSLGLVIWEMIALSTPHMLFSADESFDEDIYVERIGTRPDLPHYELDERYDVILAIFYSCTENDPNKRPTARQIVDILQAIHEGQNAAEGVTKV